jgi:hypothetical protein
MHRAILKDDDGRGRTGHLPVDGHCKPLEYIGQGHVLRDHFQCLPSVAFELLGEFSLAHVLNL